MRKACNETTADWIADECKNDQYRIGLLKARRPSAFVSAFGGKADATVRQRRGS
jgi:hypothetical protein